MGIFGRISDIISANINDLLDRCEDPEKMLAQIIREMEEKIQECRTGVAKAIAAEKQLRRELDSNEHQAAEWDKRARQAVDQGKDDLAREALLRKKEHADLAGSLTGQWEQCKATADKLKASLRALEAKVAEARRKKDTLIARQRAAEAQKEISGSLASLDASSSFSKFDRMERKVNQLEAEAGAATELATRENDLEAAFKEMESGSGVDDELAKLKQEAAARKGQA